jgi:uncharacterized repeat protein (TIGR03803 family)
MLYGTTAFGGANGDGTVFSITTSGKESVLHSFKGSGDGENPFAGLLNVKDTLYGTTDSGGADGYGTVFSVTTSGKETVLYSFKGCDDGEHPDAGLVYVKGTLYGTTDDGGNANGDGTVFSVTTSGKEIVLHRFAGGSEDGEVPSADLINVNGTLYGTTYAGGMYCEGSSGSGCGTVFSVTTSGNETVLHNFGGSGDGSYSEAGLINVDGTLFGTTSEGGANRAGTAFSITTSGTETVCYSFGTSKGDGEVPVAGVINVNGTLYGTTLVGGAKNKGTAFLTTTSGAETVLHSFGGSGDGVSPKAGFTNTTSRLFSATSEGGKNRDGTVFVLSP